MVWACISAPGKDNLHFSVGSIIRKKDKNKTFESEKYTVPYKLGLFQG